MINPASIMKIMNAKKAFENNHPKFVAFISDVFGRGIEEGTIIEITVRYSKQNGICIVRMESRIIEK